MDATLYQIFRSEIEQHLAKLQQWIDTSHITGAISNELIRTLHTIYSSSISAGVEDVAHLIDLLQNYLTHYQVTGEKLDKDGTQLIQTTVNIVHQALDNLKNEKKLPLLGYEELVNKIKQAIQNIHPGSSKEKNKSHVASIQDGELFSLFLEEARDLLDILKENIEQLEQDHFNNSAVAIIKNDLHSLKGGARIAGLISVADLAQALEKIMELLQQENNATKREEYIHLLQDSYQRLNNILTSLHERSNNTNENILRTEDLISIIYSYIQEPESSSTTSEKEDANVSVQEFIEHSISDPELISLFVEEAIDLLDSAEPVINAWTNNSDQYIYLVELQRYLHTLKGGAKMAGLTLIGDISYELETFIEHIIEAQKMDRDIIHLVQQGFDGIYRSIEMVKKNQLPDKDPNLLSLKQNLETLNKSRKLDIGDITLFSIDIDREFNPKIIEELNCDSELLIIFLKEAQEILEKASNTMIGWHKNLGEMQHIADLQRYFHTIKGGALLSHLQRIADLTQKVEQFLSLLYNYNLQAEEEIYLFIEANIIYLSKILKLLIKGNYSYDEDREYQSLYNEASKLFDKYKLLTTNLGNYPAEEECDPEMVAVFIEEAQEILHQSDQALSQLSNNENKSEAITLLQRHLHTLKGGARLASIPIIAQLTQDIESFFNKLNHLEGDININPRALSILNQSFDYLEDLIEKAKSNPKIPPEAELLALEKDFEEYFKVNTLENASIENLADIDEENYPEDHPSDLDILEMFLEESQDLLQHSEKALEAWKKETQNMEHISALQRHLHTLKGGARMSNVMIIGDFTHALETMLTNFTEKGLSPNADTFNLVQTAFDNIYNMVDTVKSTQMLKSNKDIITLQKTLEHYSGERNIGNISLNKVDTKEQAPNTAVVEISDIELPEPDEPQEVELVEMFLEEGQDILPKIEEAFYSWKNNSENHEPLKEIMRHLHTVKGSARMTGFNIIGSFVHALESMMGHFSEKGRTLDEEAAQLIQKGIDAINNMLDKAGQENKLTADIAIMHLQQLFEKYPDISAVTFPTSSKSVVTPIKKTTEKPAETPVETPTEKPKEKPASKPSLPSSGTTNKPAETERLEPIKVRADILDSLVNNAGEINIYHARIGQQITTFRFNLQELDRTAARLREQLRRIEMETDAQIQSRTEQLGSEEDIDPLEMDRYTNMQQLTRSLAETLGDLLNLKTFMTEIIRTTETLLIQQNRISTDLQESLMRTRMVKFGEKVNRFRRVLRQTCDFEGKKAELVVEGEANELDRNLLERLVGPMEHILRNAIAHGIEEPAKRRAANKKEVGTVKIEVFREGGEIVIIVKDDGAGINTQKVFEIGIKKGLVPANAQLTERQKMYILLEPGFSTAEKISQVAGRGVGMDVVASEVKQLGGTLEIDSILGKGAVFTIRLPFTLAINQSLIVQIDESDYAIPIVNIEGIARVPVEALKELYQKQQKTQKEGVDNSDLEEKFKYPGLGEYKLRYLGNILGHVLDINKLEIEGEKPKPVLLARSGDIRLALHVDGVKGIQEVVVKSVGTQLSQVSGISGATILGDGRVILILEINSIIRKADVWQWPIKEKTQKTPVKSLKTKEKPVVMVVDDSVTVRRVTERFLKRFEMEPITARDGVDAIAVLQEQTPDIMLLDIEMPRMDGFELATHIRNQPHLKDMPIIMISSRVTTMNLDDGTPPESASRHIWRAKEIGVNRLLGKPYQDAELLNNINELLKKNTDNAS